MQGPESNDKYYQPWRGKPFAALLAAEIELILIKLII
jgi:hypothetical protein